MTETVAKQGDHTHHRLFDLWSSDREGPVIVFLKTVRSLRNCIKKITYSGAGKRKADWWWALKKSSFETGSWVRNPVCMERWGMQKVQEQSWKERPNKQDFWQKQAERFPEPRVHGHLPRPDAGGCSGKGAPTLAPGGEAGPWDRKSVV